MIDCARPYEPNMCDLYLPPTPSATTPLENFQALKKNSTFTYANYYNTYPYEPEVDSTANIYHSFLNPREIDYYPNDWRYKSVLDWTEDDTIAWLFDTALSLGYNEQDVNFCAFRIPGIELRGMRRDEMIQRMSHPNIEPTLSRRLGEVIYEKLQYRLGDETQCRQASVIRNPESDLYPHHETVQTVLDLDSWDHKNRLCTSDYRPNDSSLLHPPCDSSDDAEDGCRNSETASPEYLYGSDGSKSGDEDDKRKIHFKRPPGRPRGSGRKICKRPRSVSVPEFLRNLLLDPKYCPSIIKWEDHSEGKFRFVKPDEVAKLWGKMKQNDNMTFEKFSRAMRYHYRQSVLVSVPAVRLVYQFGHKGPDFKTDNPNFAKIKSETDSHDMLYS